MKTRLLIIIVGIIIVGSVIFALFFEYSFEKEHYEIKIQGMKDSYRIGDEYSFYYTLSGFGNMCGSWLVSYPDKNGVIQNRGAVVDCTHISNSNLSYDSRQDGREFTSFVPEIEGRYNATVSLENGASVTYTFTVLSKKDPPRDSPPEPPFIQEDPTTKIEIMFGKQLSNKLVPVIITEVTNHAENLDKITVWNFQLITHSADDKNTTWDQVPKGKRIFYEITDADGQDAVDHTRMPENWAVPDVLHIYEMDCGLFHTIRGESAYPTTFPITNNTKSIFAKNSWMGIYPDSEGKYSFEFASLFENYVRFPEDSVEIISHYTKECKLTQSTVNNVEGKYNEGYYTKMTFRFK